MSDTPTLPFRKKFDESGPASDWTPRQALMAALTECDTWESVVIIARQKETDETRGIQCTADRLERMGLLADAMVYGWNKPDVE